MANRIDIETRLAAAVRACLSATPNQFVSEDESVRDVCRWLSRITQELLRDTDDWSGYAWVDDISPCTVTRQLPDTFTLTGLLIWGAADKKSFEWKEPLFASIHLPGSSPPYINYDLRVGDADRGLTKCPYGAPHDYPYVPVKHWLFTFRNTGE